MRSIIALVDYDNATRQPELAQPDVALNLALLGKWLSDRLSVLIPDSEDLWLRLYGGWIMLDI